MNCRICGDTGAGFRYGMALCPACKLDAVPKVSFDRFVAATFANDPEFDLANYGDRAIAREFYDDYRFCSKISDPAEYWERCSQ